MYGVIWKGIGNSIYADTSMEGTIASTACLTTAIVSALIAVKHLRDCFDANNHEKQKSLLFFYMFSCVSVLVGLDVAGVIQLTLVTRSVALATALFSYHLTHSHWRFSI